MFQLLVNAEGGLTAAGYGVCIAAGVLLFLAAAIVAGKNSEKNRMTTRQLVFCAMAVALAFVTSYIKIFRMPWGGSVTLCSMLFIVLVANWYGVKTGILVGLAYSILQFIQENTRICCRAFRKTIPWSGKGICGSGVGKRSVSFSGRLSLLDGLYAGEFPAVAEEHLSDCVQLQLSAGGGAYYLGCYIDTRSCRSIESGEEDGCILNSLGAAGIDLPCGVFLGSIF